MTRGSFASVLMFGLLLSVTSTAFAGPHSDALGQCLSRSITAEEKTTLIRWSYFVMAAHPALQEGLSVEPEQRTALAKKTAKILERLLVQSCAAESRAATKHEGALGLGTAFAFLNQFAFTELVTNKEVREAVMECVHHMDKEKLIQVIVP